MVRSSRILRKIAGQKIYRFERIAYFPSFLSEAAISTTDTTGRRTFAVGINSYAGMKLSFEPQNITNWSEISNLFQYYKMLSITYIFSFVHNTSPMQTNTAVGAGTGQIITGDYLPEVTYVVDRENHPTGTFPDISQFEGTRTFRFGTKRTLAVTYKPMVFDTVADVYGTVTQTPRPAIWVDTTQSTLNYSGLSMRWYNGDGTNSPNFTVMARARFLVRQMK